VLPTRSAPAAALLAISGVKMDTDRMIATQNEDGSLSVFVPVEDKMKELLAQEGLLKKQEPTEMQAASTWTDGTYYFPNSIPGESYYRLPKLSIPSDYYERVQWSNEYYEQEPMVEALVNRDIDQAIQEEEFQLPEDQEGPKKALQEWRAVLNRDMGQQGGLSEYNRGLVLDLMLSGLSFTLGNWGSILVDNKVYEVPRNLINLNPMSLIPDIDTFTGRRTYYYRLSAAQYEAIKNRRKNSISEIIPDAKSRLVDDIQVVADKLRNLGYNYLWMANTQGYYLELPTDDSYIINFRSRQHDRFPTPSLTSIFSAIAMKRKLQLADWAVADGMVNMIMVWEFPPGTDAKKAKSLVQKFTAGGRVQSHGVPSGVKVSIITPESDILNSSEKFWQPVSEILLHFGYPLNSKSRGAGDLDSGTLDAATNRARLDIWRETIEDHNNFWLREIKKRNNWDFELFCKVQSRDLDETDQFRVFVQNAFDRGALSYESYHAALKTSTDREASRRKKEAKEGLEDVFEIRETFKQSATTGPTANGRPEGSTKASGAGQNSSPGRDSQSGSGQRKT
jgi:hypothetical protein